VLKVVCSGLGWQDVFMHINVYVCSYPLDLVVINVDG